MIKIAYQELEYTVGYEEVINNRIPGCTCKTNISPQLLFIESYTGITDKTFVGNWTKKGFWISKYRKQLFQFRPDIITKFVFITSDKKTVLKINYSIGFSSIFMGLIWILLISSIFATLGLTVFIISLLLLLIFYLMLAFESLEATKISIKEKILIEI